MRIFLWITGVMFALTAIPAVFYFVLYAARGDNVLRERAVKFYRWAALIFLATFNTVIYGNIFVALFQMWGWMKY
jgi:hypothetical protein